MTVAVLVAGEGYRMVKAKDLGYSDNLNTASSSQTHRNNGNDVLSTRSIRNIGSFNSGMPNGSYKAVEKGGEKDIHLQQDSMYMNVGSNREKVRCPKKRFSLSAESTSNMELLSRKRAKADNSDSNLSTSSLPEDTYEKIELFSKSTPTHVRLQILTQEVQKLKNLEKHEKKNAKRKKKQQEEEIKRNRKQQRALNLENNHRPKFEEAFCDSPSSSSSNDDDALMFNHTSKPGESTDGGEQFPCRRLSMLAAASLLESVNNKSSSASTKSLEESSDKNDDDDDEEEEEEGKGEINSTTHRSSPDNSTKKRGRRDSTESTDELEELINVMSRRSSMHSTSSSTDGDHNSSDKSNNPTIGNAIVSRRLSLIAAQAASLESRSLTRRASLIAAAEIFESLNQDAVSRRRSSIIGNFNKRMSFDRRQSLVAVSQLLTGIENVNEPRRPSAMYRRGSEISLGSVFSSMGGDSSEISPVLPSRRASIDPFGTNIANVSRVDLESNSKSVLGNVSGNATQVATDGISITNPKEIVEGSRFPMGIDYESFKTLYVSMEKSKASQIAIHDWDRKMGLRRSHSQTMRNSSRSRKKLITVMTLSSKSN